MSDDKARPHVVFTLIHGTFSSERTWPTASLLRDTLEQEYGSGCCLPFAWSGKNGNNARQEAASRLISHVNDTRTKFCDARHVLIAHSHGGHVALYALKGTKLEAAVNGVVTLGTPFLYAEPRDSRKFLTRYFLWLPFRVAFVFLILFLGGVVFLANANEPEFRFVTNDLLWSTLYIGAWAFVLSPLVPLFVLNPESFSMFVNICRGRAVVRRRERPLTRRFRLALIRWICRSQRDTVESLRLPSNLKTPILCIQNSTDEAYLLLFFQNLLTYAPIVAYRLFVTAPFLIASFVLIFFAAIIFRIEALPFHIDAVLAFSYSMFLFATVVLLGAIIEFICALAIWFTQGQWWGYGSGRLGMYLWCNVSVDRFPDGPFNVQYFRSSVRRRFLEVRHSKYYDDSRVVEKTLTWIRYVLSPQSPSHVETGKVP